jgi:hypothetical protein
MLNDQWVDEETREEIKNSWNLMTMKIQLTRTAEKLQRQN